MAPKRKSRNKHTTPLIKKSATNAGETSKTRNTEKETVSRKRKAFSETRRRCSKRHKPVKSNSSPPRRSKRFRTIKSSSSIELIGVHPCCSSNKERKKYAKLGLDSALFFSNSKPAKHRQSHISVITISSSDDEDLNNDQTADWISKMDLERINISSNEEPFPSGDADFSQNDSMAEEILDADQFRPRRSCTNIFSTPHSIFKPLCASTPQSIFQHQNFVTSEREDENQLTYKGPSFLENPITNLGQNLTALKFTDSSHAIPSTTQKYRGDEYKVESVLKSRTFSPKFYFGPSQNQQHVPQMYENSQTTNPMLSDLSYFSNRQTPNTNTNTFSTGIEKPQTEARSYSLDQVPSTSNAPVSNPVLEAVPKRKKSIKSKNNSSSK